MRMAKSSFIYVSGDPKVIEKVKILKILDIILETLKGNMVFTEM